MQKYCKDKSRASIVVNVPDTNRSVVGPLQSVSNHFLCSVLNSSKLHHRTGKGVLPGLTQQHVRPSWFHGFRRIGPWRWTLGRLDAWKQFLPMVGVLHGVDVFGVLVVRVVDSCCIVLMTSVSTDDVSVPANRRTFQNVSCCPILVRYQVPGTAGTV